MELTKEEAQKLIEARLHEYPAMQAIAKGEHFTETLAQILDFEEVGQEYLPILENEVLVILSLYAPLYELAQNIQESTELTERQCGEIANLIETLLFQPVYTDLVAYSYLWDAEQAKESTAPDANTPVSAGLRPGASASGQGTVNPIGPKPLTREEVLRALAPKRTMATDSVAAKHDEDITAIPKETM